MKLRRCLKFAVVVFVTVAVFIPDTTTAQRFRSRRPPAVSRQGLPVPFYPAPKEPELQPGEYIVPGSYRVLSERTITAPREESPRPKIVERLKETVKETFSSIEERLLNVVNRERARHGLHPLVLDSSLCSSASSHSGWMTRNGMRHGHSGMWGASWRRENIAITHSQNPEHVFGLWLNSSGHRANILASGITRMGIGLQVAPNGAVYWTQQFK